MLNADRVTLQAIIEGALFAVLGVAAQALVVGAVLAAIS
jgi:hypothetical protein